MSSKDITFCTTVHCAYRFTCKRHINNNTFEEGELVSQCDFKPNDNIDVHCDYFIR